MILGISSGFADYRMAWEINNCLDVQLMLSEESIEVFDKKNSSTHSFRVHNFFLEETQTSFYLIRNKQFHTYLVPERPQIDYYFFIRELHEINLEEIIMKLRTVNGITAVFDLSNEYIDAIDFLTF